MRIARLLLILPLLVSMAAAADQAAAPAADLVAARAEFARHWFDPAAHLRLAQAVRRAQRPLVAFYISEDARRTFGDEDFDRAFLAVVLDVDASTEGRARLQEAYAKDRTARNAMRCADAAANAKDHAEAERFAREAVALAPDDHGIVGSLAAIIGEDEARKQEADALLDRYYAAHPDSAATLNHAIAEMVDRDRSRVAGMVAAALARYPDDAELVRMHGAVLLDARDLDAADAEMRRAAELDAADGRPTSAIQGPVAAYFLKGRKRPELALPYYLACYFADPHFSDGKYAESRIRSISYGTGGQLFAAIMAAHPQDLPAAIGEGLRHADPVVVGDAFDGLDENWQDSMRADVTALLAHDDPNLREMASRALQAHPRADAADEARRLLEDPDARIRGMACYLVAAADPAGAVATLTPLLKDEADLLRYDAASALLMHGGPAGRAAVVAVAAKEPHPWWREQLQHFLEQR